MVIFIILLLYYIMIKHIYLYNYDHYFYDQAAKLDI